MTENKRFTEIISTQKVIDNETGEEYDCLIDDKLLELLNELNNENKELEIEYRRLTRFLMKNGYTLSDYLKYCEENEFK